MNKTKRCTTTFLIGSVNNASSTAVNQRILEVAEILL